jgi:tetratricopeptide (TPR) repeat protein
MSPQISIWAGLIGITTAIPIGQKILVSKPPVLATEPSGVSLAALVDKALVQAHREIQIDRDFVRVDRHRGHLKAEKLQNNPGTMADVDRAIQHNPNDAIAYKNRGDLKAKLQNIQGSLADFDRAIAIDPNYAIADLQQAARLYQQQGDLENYQLTIDLLKKWQATSQSAALWLDISGTHAEMHTVRNED